jgi:P27 family predicted phage terminase small subunit
MTPKAPANLSREAKDFWDSIVADYEMDDAASQRLLATACEALDRMREAQRSIKQHGAVTTDRWGQLRPNPSTVIERDARAAMLACLKALNLDVAPPGRAGR